MQAISIAVSIIHIILAILMIVIILLQSSKSSGLSGSIGGASETFFGKNQVKTLDKTLSKITAFCAIAFLVTSIFLAYSFTLNKNSATPDANQAPVVSAPAAQAPAVSVAPVAPSAKPAQ